MRSLWQSVRTRVEEQHKPLRAQLARATVEAVDESTVTIGIAGEIQASILREKAALIETALREMLQMPVRVAVRVSDGVASSPRASPPTVTRTHEPIDEDDLLGYAMQQFQPLEDDR